MKVTLAVGIILFIFLFVMGIWLEFPVGESALAAIVLTVVGMIVTWWKMHFD